jgi:hypothetical protein
VLFGARPFGLVPKYNFSSLIVMLMPCPANPGEADKNPAEIAALEECVPPDRCSAAKSM